VSARAVSATVNQITSPMPADAIPQATPPALRAIIAHPNSHHATGSTIRNSASQQNPIPTPLSEIPQLGQKGNPVGQ
jgi:hypothetical protein